VVDDLKRDTATWIAAIQHVLEDPDRSFAHAAEVRDKLAPHLTWRTTALTDRIGSLCAGR
jgi:hypothetical protein